MSQRVYVKDVKRAAKAIGRTINSGCYFSGDGECCPLAALTYEGVRRNLENVTDELALRRIEKKFGKAYSSGFIEAFDGWGNSGTEFVGKALSLYNQGFKDGEKLRKAFGL